MARTILGVLIGLLVAGTVVFALEAVGHLIYPPPAGFDPRDEQAVRALASQLPAGAFAFVLLGWVAAAGLGAWIAVRVSRDRPAWPGMVVGALLLAAAGYNMWTIPHPTWFVASAVVGIGLATWLGVRTARAGPVASAA